MLSCPLLVTSMLKVFQAGRSPLGFREVNLTAKDMSKMGTPWQESEAGYIASGSAEFLWLPVWQDSGLECGKLCSAAAAVWSWG